MSPFCFWGWPKEAVHTAAQRRLVFSRSEPLFRAVDLLPHIVVLMCWGGVFCPGRLCCCSSPRWQWFMTMTPNLWVPFFLVCGTGHCKGVGGNQISQLLLSSCLEHGGEISYVRRCGFLDDTPEWLASLRGAVNRWTRVKDTKWRQMLDFQPDVILPHGPKWGIITFQQKQLLGVCYKEQEDGPVGKRTCSQACWFVIPEIHIAEGENHLLQVVLWRSHMDCGLYYPK